MKQFVLLVESGSVDLILQKVRPLSLMTRKLRRYFFPTLFVLIVGIVLGMGADLYQSGNDTYDQLRKLEDAFLLIDRQYVEEVDSKTLAESAILAMLKELDPHSSYIDSDRIRSVQEEYQGSFGGIGIWFEVPANDTARVTSTFPDGPSESVGVMAGDRMIGAGGEDIVGAGSLDIQALLKGTAGTDVRLTVMRPGVAEAITFNITRAILPLYTVDASYMIDENTGFIRIGRFAMTTHEEFLDHLNRLKAQGLERLVLDLRGNPGGIKKAAVDIADELLDGNGTIVFTRGRNPQENEVDRITPGGAFDHAPVIVLVDENSASGSEIVAGALQDHDRALIVGRRTFGKGLVQRPFQLRDGSVLQMTVSRYYMPSGRLIQTPYENGEIEDYYREKLSGFEQATTDPGAYLHDLPDSLKFETRHGRTVFGGGGVMPDIVVAPDSLSPLANPIVRSVLRRTMASAFVRNWYDSSGPSMRQTWENRSQAFYDEYTVTEDFWQEFVGFTQEQGLTFTGQTEAVDHAAGLFSSDDLGRAEATLKTILKARIAQRLYRSAAWWPVFNQIDPTVTAALDLWTNAEVLSAYHSLDERGTGNQGN